MLIHKTSKKISIFNLVYQYKNDYQEYISYKFQKVEGFYTDKKL